METRSKLNSIESKMSEALIINEFSREDFMTILNEEKKYWELNNWELKWWIVTELMLKKLVWLKKVKKGINEVIKRNEIINNSLK